MKNALCTFALVLLALVLTGGYVMAAGAPEGTAQEERTVTLKLGTSYPPAAPETRGCELFAELVQEGTGGKVLVEVFPSEQLGSAKAQLEATMLGNQDLYLEGSVWYERWSETLRFLGVSFAFRDREHFRLWTQSDDWKQAWTKVTADSGLVFLDHGNWERGPYRVLVSTKPLRTLDDLKDLRVRVWPADAYKRSWEALGARPTEMAWTDVYLGLRLGTVEAAAGPVSLVYPMKFTEVAKHIIYWPEFPQVVRMAMNKKKFDSLKPEYQQVLIDAANKAGQFFTEISESQADLDIQKCIDEHGAEYYKGMDLALAAQRMTGAIRKLEAEGFLPAGVYDRMQALGR